ncbi:MAG: hypothetical protein KatS3mg081_2500 [Gemmatimonadales bacterium]|nr:MAG: hypothetical protein KatS3mg081_2500 [Gemmatimonadales bacterium]
MKRNLPIFTRRMLPVLAALVLGSISARTPAMLAQQEPSQSAAADTRQIEMIVTGLSCPLCAYGLEKKLGQLEGLDSVSVDFKTGRVRLLFRDGSEVSDERLHQLVRDAGFEISEIKRSRDEPRSGRGSGAGPRG